SVNGRFTYHEGAERIPEELAPPVSDRNFSIKADIDVPQGGAEGVLVSMGGSSVGYSLYVKNSRPVFVLNHYGDHWYTIESDQPLRSGRNTVRLVFTRTDAFQGRGELSLNGTKVAEGDMPTLRRRAAPINETFDVGSDRGTPVARDYASPFVFTGTIHSV